MRCPICSSQDTQVKDTRLAESGLEILRRRKCLACGKRFKTLESIQISLPVVVKRNGARSEYNSAKLKASMRLALRKRPVPADAVDTAVMQIEDTLATLGEKEIGSQFIGELVMKQLRRIDNVAYVRFASVYKNFREVQDFENFLGELKDHKK